MKGVLLAGGLGTRLYPLTKTVSKQLLPVHDKPMIYYPLSVLMLAGIREVLIISSPRDLPLIQSLLCDGRQWGLSIKYVAQLSPDGLAHALILAEEFLAGSSVCLILGDNVFYGHGFISLLANAKNKIESSEFGACVFGYYVNDPQRYGVVSFDEQFSVIAIEEKPAKPASNFAVTGLYFFDNKASSYAKMLTPSSRGELEISDLNQMYLVQQRLSLEVLGRGFAWLDVGTHESRLEASIYISTIEKRQGLKVGCPEEIAWRKGYISDVELRNLANLLSKTAYAEYLHSLLDGHSLMAAANSPYSEDSYV